MRGQGGREGNGGDVDAGQGEILEDRMTWRALGGAMRGVWGERKSDGGSGLLTRRQWVRPGRRE